MAEQTGLSLTWSETPKTGFLMAMLNYVSQQKKTCLRGQTVKHVQFGIPLTLVESNINSKEMSRHDLYSVDWDIEINHSTKESSVNQSTNDIMSTCFKPSYKRCFSARCQVNYHKHMF